MRMSPFSSVGSRSAMVLSTTAAGTMSHTARGLSSFFTKSVSEVDPIAFSCTSSCTVLGDMSKTTHWCPPLMRRRTMLAPIRPSPIIPSCMAVSLLARLELAIAADEGVGRAVVLEGGFRARFELADDALGEHLAQLYTPLVEGVDAPDRPLGEHGMLVQGHELAEGLRGEPVEEDGVGWTIALEDPVRHQTVRGALGLHLARCLAEGQRLCLGEDVGDQHVVVVAQGIQGVDEADEVAGDEPRPLVDELIERVLAVGPRLAPVDRPCVVVHAPAVQADVFAVRFHGQLLEIRWEALEVLLVGQHGHRLRAEEVVVPD